MLSIPTSYNNNIISLHYAACVITPPNSPLLHHNESGAKQHSSIEMSTLPLSVLSRVILNFSHLSRGNRKQRKAISLCRVNQGHWVRNKQAICLINIYNTSS